MGMFASGVTIVTVAHEGQMHGMTANSVMSVSLRPPLVAVAVDERALTNALIREAGHFALNILTEEQQTLAERFAKRRARGTELFDGVAFEAGPHGDPLIDGCIGRVSCELTSSHIEGDHSLFVGRAVAFSSSSAKGNPLIFYRGRFSAVSCQFCIVRSDPVVALMAMHES